MKNISVEAEPVLEEMKKEIDLKQARRTLFYLLEKADLSECEIDKRSEIYLIIFHVCEILKK